MLRLILKPLHAITDNAIWIAESELLRSLFMEGNKSLTIPATANVKLYSKQVEICDFDLSWLGSNCITRNFVNGNFNGLSRQVRISEKHFSWSINCHNEGHDYSMSLLVVKIGGVSTFLENTSASDVFDINIAHRNNANLIWFRWMIFIAICQDFLASAIDI